MLSVPIHCVMALSNSSANAWVTYKALISESFSWNFCQTGWQFNKALWNLMSTLQNKVWKEKVFFFASLQSTNGAYGEKRKILRFYTLSVQPQFGTFKFWLFMKVKGQCFSFNAEVAMLHWIISKPETFFMDRIKKKSV